LCEKEQQVYLLCEDSKSLDECNAELSIMGLYNKTIIINELKPDILQERLTEITTRHYFILLSTYDLLTCVLPNQDQIRKNTIQISVGGDLSYNNLVEYLNLLKYQKENFVEAPGDFSQRGAIIDFWSYGEKTPVRLEFDGDFIESIRRFEPESQRSIEPIQITTLSSELIPSLYENTSNIFDYLKNPVVMAGKYALDNITIIQKDTNREETHLVTQIHTKTMLQKMIS
jgi:transcription-repair coupling factor (superfamily II helicase)